MSVLGARDHGLALLLRSTLAEEVLLQHVQRHQALLAARVVVGAHHAAARAELVEVVRQLALAQGLAALGAHRVAALQVVEVHGDPVVGRLDGLRRLINAAQRDGAAG